MAGLSPRGLLLAAVLTALSLGVVRADTPTEGNDIFRVLVEDRTGRDGLGVFGAITGVGHPLGGGVDVIASEGGTDAFSSYVTVRSYTTGTDYVQTNDHPASGNIVLGLEQFGLTDPVAGGYDTLYQVPAGAPSREALDITTGIVTSQTGDEGVIRVYASVTNQNDHPVELGGRILFDLAHAGDEGPSIVAGGQPFGREADVPPDARITAVSDDGEGAVSLRPLGDADAVKLAHWNRAFESAFDFETSGVDVSSEGGLNDSALLIYFGSEAPTATLLQSGETFEFGAEISSTTELEVCNNDDDDDGDGLVDGDDPDCGPSPTRTSVPTTTPSLSPSPSAHVGTSIPTTAPTAIRPAGFPNTGGPLGLGDSGWLILTAFGAALAAAAGGSVFAGRRRRP